MDIRRQFTVVKVHYARNYFAGLLNACKFCSNRSRTVFHPRQRTVFVHLYNAFVRRSIHRVRAREIDVMRDVLNRRGKLRSTVLLYVLNRFVKRQRILEIFDRIFRFFDGRIRHVAILISAVYLLYAPVCIELRAVNILFKYRKRRCIFSVVGISVRFHRYVRRSTHVVFLANIRVGIRRHTVFRFCNIPDPHELSRVVVQFQVGNNAVRAIVRIAAFIFIFINFFIYRAIARIENVIELFYACVIRRRNYVVFRNRLPRHNIHAHLLCHAVFRRYQIGIFLLPQFRNKAQAQRLAITNGRAFHHFKTRRTHRLRYGELYRQYRSRRRSCHRRNYQRGK